MCVCTCVCTLYFYHLINIYVSGAGLDVGHIKTRPNHPLAFLGSSWEPQQKKFRVCVCARAPLTRMCMCKQPHLSPSHTPPWWPSLPVQAGEATMVRELSTPPAPSAPDAGSPEQAWGRDGRSHLPSCLAFPSLFFPCGQMKESAAVLPTIAGCLYGPHCRLAPALWPCELVHCSPPGRAYGWMSYSPRRKEPYSRASIIGEAFRLGLRALQPPLHPFRFEKAWERGGVIRSTSPRRFH